MYYHILSCKPITNYYSGKKHRARYSKNESDKKNKDVRGRSIKLGNKSDVDMLVRKGGSDPTKGQICFGKSSAPRQCNGQRFSTIPLEHTESLQVFLNCLNRLFYNKDSCDTINCSRTLLCYYTYINPIVAFINKYIYVFNPTNNILPCFKIKIPTSYSSSFNNSFFFNFYYNIYKGM